MSLAEVTIWFVSISKLPQETRTACFETTVKPVYKAAQGTIKIWPFKTGSLYAQVKTLFIYSLETYMEVAFNTGYTVV